MIDPINPLGNSNPFSRTYKERINEIGEAAARFMEIESALKNMLARSKTPAGGGGRASVGSATVIAGVITDIHPGENGCTYDVQGREEPEVIGLDLTPDDREFQNVPYECWPIGKVVDLTVSRETDPPSILLFKAFEKVQTSECADEPAP